MISEDLEYAISQYLDGTLPPLERARVEKIVRTDPDAGAALAEFRKLNAMFRSSAVPEVSWDKLSARISNAVAQEHVPTKSYPLHWIKPVGVAIAAMLVIGFMIPQFMPRTRETSTGTATVSGPEVEVAQVGTKSVDVSIGPSAEVTDAGYRYSDLIARPSRVNIAAGGEVAQDGKSY